MLPTWKGSYVHRFACALSSLHLLSLIQLQYPRAGLKSGRSIDDNQYASIPLSPKGSLPVPVYRPT